MKGNDEVLTLFNNLLTNELTAINQYFIHAKMCKNWGYDRLAHKIRDESIDEMKHADMLVTRILFLEGLPNLQRLGKLTIGVNVPEILKNDHAVEMIAIPLLNKGMQQCRDLGDNGSEDLLRRILARRRERQRARAGGRT